MTTWRSPGAGRGVAAPPDAGSRHRRPSVCGTMIAVTARPPLPPDPRKYDEPRNAAARRRGLEAPYIAGGEDPDLSETLRRERRDLRLLVAMVIGVVLLGFVLGIAGSLIGALRA